MLETLLDAGKEFGLSPAGMHSMNNARMEKAYRHWGHDISDEDTPVEAGLGFVVAWDKKGGFIGKRALAKQRDRNVQPKRLVCLALADGGDKAPLMYHEEPIYRDGEIVGSTTSGATGPAWRSTSGRWVERYSPGRLRIETGSTACASPSVTG